MGKVLIDADELAELRDDAQFAREVVAALGSADIQAGASLAVVTSLQRCLVALSSRTVLRELSKKARQQP